MITLIAERYLVRVRFVQSGGIIGAMRGCDLDTASLPPADARELESLVDVSGIVTSGRFLSRDGHDLRTYEITVDRAGDAVAATYDDGTLPDLARPLVGFLRSRSAPKAAE
jgi:hypothetical protein